MPAARAGPPPAAPRPAPGGGVPAPPPRSRTAAADEHQEVDAAADLPRRCRRLIHHRLETEQLHVHRHRHRVAGRDGEVTRVLQRDEPLLRRRLRDRAHVAERAAAPAVAHIVQLEDDTARIGDEQIARAAVGRPAFVLPAHTNERLLRSRLLRSRGRRGNAVRGERLQRAIDGEVLHAESERADARRFTGRRLPKREESGSVTNAEQYGRALAHLHRHPEQSLVELERSLDV